ncbi:MAG: MFS transporter, partial [Desulfobulbia bacterium]
MKTNNTVLPVLFILVVLGALGIDIFLPSFPNMMEYFQVNKSQIQLTISVYILFYGIGQLLIGGYSDKKGRRASALIGTGLYLTGSIIGASSNEFNLLLAGRAFQGLGGASTTVSAMAWVRENYSQKESVKWLSYMVGAIGIVPAFAPFIGSALA